MPLKKFLYLFIYLFIYGFIFNFFNDLNIYNLFAFFFFFTHLLIYLFVDCMVNENYFLW